LNNRILVIFSNANGAPQKTWKFVKGWDGNKNSPEQKMRTRMDDGQ